MQTQKKTPQPLKSWLIALLPILLIAACARPIANFSYQPSNKHTAPAKIAFQNQSQKATQYQWDFGDGNTSTKASPTHEYKTSGNYTIILRASKGKKTTTKEKRILIDAPEDCLVNIETNFGTMTVRLYNATPQHRDNFIKLAEENYFDSLLFHRIIDGFMIQGGDPNSRNAQAGKPLGAGGPGYTVPAEFVDTLAHTKGSLAAARTGDASNPEKRSSGSQFYIVHGRTFSEQELSRIAAQKGIRYTPQQLQAYQQQGGAPFLDGEYTVFGTVIKGLDIIDKIAKVATDPRDRPSKDVWMKIKVIK